MEKSEIINLIKSNLTIETTKESFDVGPNCRISVKLVFDGTTISEDSIIVKS